MKLYEFTKRFGKTKIGHETMISPSFYPPFIKGSVMFLKISQWIVNHNELKLN